MCSRYKTVLAHEYLFVKILCNSVGFCQIWRRNNEDDNITISYEIKAKKVLPRQFDKYEYHEKLWKSKKLGDDYEKIRKNAMKSKNTTKNIRLCFYNFIVGMMS